MIMMRKSPEPSNDATANRNDIAFCMLGGSPDLSLCTFRMACVVDGAGSCVIEPWSRVAKPQEKRDYTTWCPGKDLCLCDPAEILCSVTYMLARDGQELTA